MSLSAAQIRQAFIACARDYDELWDEVCAANREHGGYVDKPWTARQDEAYDRFFVVREEYFRLERALDRLED